MLVLLILFVDAYTLKNLHKMPRTLRVSENIIIKKFFNLGFHKQLKLHTFIRCDNFNRMYTRIILKNFYKTTCDVKTVYA
jgi:hypothetical protein